MRDHGYLFFILYNYHRIDDLFTIANSCAVLIVITTLIMVKFLSWFYRYEVAKQKDGKEKLPPVTGIKYSKLRDPEACLHQVQKLPSGSGCVTKVTQKPACASTIQKNFDRIYNGVNGHNPSSAQYNDLQMDTCNSLMSLSVTSPVRLKVRDDTDDSGIGRESCLECQKERNSTFVHKRYARRIAESNQRPNTSSCVSPQMRSSPRSMYPMKRILRTPNRLQERPGTSGSCQSAVLRKRLKSRKYYMNQQSNESSGKFLGVFEF